MPIYEYKCIDCNEYLEDLRSIQSRDDLMECRKCRAPMQRILSTFNTTKKTKTDNPLASLEEPVRAPLSGGAAIKLEGGASATVDGCMIKNWGVGVSMTKGSKINIKGAKFVNVRTPFEVIDE